jgi:hypothetical protein
MVRLTLVMTIMLAVIGLPKALQPLLFQSEPRLVILTTGETPHVLNPGARASVKPPVSIKPPEALMPVEALKGSQLSQLQPYAEQLIGNAPRTHTQS